MTPKQYKKVAPSNFDFMICLVFYVGFLSLKFKMLVYFLKCQDNSVLSSFHNVKLKKKGFVDIV